MCRFLRSSAMLLLLLFSRSVVSDSFVIPWTGAWQALLSMGFPSQECRSRLPFPSSGDLPDPEIKPVSPALAGGLFITEPPWKPSAMLTRILKESLDPSGIAGDVWLILRWHWIYNHPNPEPSVQRARSIQMEYSYNFKINTDQMESHSTKKKNWPAFFRIMKDKQRPRNCLWFKNTKRSWRCR